MLKKNKILIIRFSSIGDIVLTTPVIRCLKQQLPNAEIHFLTKKRFESLLIDNPYIDHLHLFDKNLKSFTLELKQQNFDVVIDLHNNLRSKFVRVLLSAKTFKFNKINFEKWLMVTFKINILPIQHIVDRYLETCSTLNVKNDGKGLDFFINAQTNIDRLNINESYFVYAIGGQHETKKMPLNKQIELLNTINFKVILIGGKEDEKQGKELALKCSNVLNLCGQLSIHESALLIKNARLVITHDTGMMHIAAALNKNIISIWGNTIPAFGMSPYLPEHSITKDIQLEVKDLSCRPCSKIGFKTCPKKHFNCMNLLTFNDLNFKQFNEN